MVCDCTRQILLTGPRLLAHACGLHGARFAEYAAMSKRHMCVLRNDAIPPRDHTGGRVEERRGGVQDRRRLTHATPFGVTFAEKSIAPFPLPAHRTGRDHFGHPALGRISHGGMRSAPTWSSIQTEHPQFPKDAPGGELPEARPGDFVPPAKKATDRMVQMSVHRAPRF